MSNVPIQESYIFRKNTPSSISSSSSGSSSSSFSSMMPNFQGQGKNILILLLILLLILSFLGINILYYFAGGIEYTGSSIVKFFSKILSLIGYSTGVALDKTSETVSTVAKTGIDIADGAVDNLAKLMKESSKLDGKVKSKIAGEVIPDDTSDPIQKSISSGKNNWCLVGDDLGVRSCVHMDEYDKCMSGQIFPSKQRCMLPTNLP